VTPAEAKALARTEAYARRKVAFAVGQGRAADHLAEVLAGQGARPLSGYMSMRTEIDPRAAMASYGGPVSVPVITGRDQPLRFRRWTPGCPMEQGEFGAMIPVAGDWIEPEVLIVPLLAFDARGFRLGYGGGYYDRTLAKLRMLGPRLAIGFAFAAQEVDAVPTDATDQRLDMIVTEAGLRRFS
jgi:5-formyltetrahydrofolate cyclo-ligase